MILPIFCKSRSRRKGRPVGGLLLPGEGSTVRQKDPQIPQNKNSRSIPHSGNVSPTSRTSKGKRKQAKGTGEGGRKVKKTGDRSDVNNIPNVLDNTVADVFNFEHVKGIDVMYTNADIVTNKLEELRTRVANANPHVIGVTEVKPKHARFKLSPAELKIYGYNLLHNSLDNGNGERGCALYIRSTMESQCVQFKSDFSDCVWAKINMIGDDTLLIGCMYRSPNSTVEKNAALRKLLVEASNLKYSHLLVMGDFNFPRIDWNSWSTPGRREEDEDARFIESVRDGYPYQHVLQPTRVRGEQKPSLIDLILSNEDGMVSDLEVQSPIGKSDHGVLSFKFHCYNIQLVDAPPKFLFNKGRYDRMKEDIGKVKWEQVVNEDDHVNKQWKNFSDIIKENMDKHIPKRKIVPGRKKKHLTPLDKNAVKKIKKKHRAWTRFMESRESKHYQIYCQLRNKVRSITRKSRILHEKAIAAEAKSNPKKFWNFAKSQTKVKETISNLKTKNATTSTDEEKAEVLLEQFTSVFTEDPPGDVPGFDKREVEFEVPLLTITQDMVYKKLDSINKTKSAGPDEIHPRVYYELRDVITTPLTTLFNSSLSQKEIPDDWRLANISPIFKKGKKEIPSNYRPVSLTCIASKILESFVRDHIITHMKINRLLSNRQFGFLSGRSTVLQLLKVLDNWTELLNEKSRPGIDAIYMDFQKAFDKVPHQRLLHKMSGYGFDGQMQDWVSAFLRDRKHRVVVNGKVSSQANVLSGIPQGSVLGPILFVLYINDLPNTVQNEVFLFADDTKIYSRISNISDANSLQQDLISLQAWSDTWLLPFHPDKCKVLRLGRRLDPPYQYEINDTLLAHVKSEKDLGVTIDNDLKFREHIDEKVNKANSMMGIIRRSFKHLDTDTFCKLYKGLVRPNLEYAATVWSPHLKGDIRKLESVQRRATKQLNDFKNLDYDERLKKLKLPTLIYRRLRGDMIEVYKILTKKYDPLVCDILPLHTTHYPNSCSRGHSKKLLKRSHSLDLRKFSFSMRTTDIWNSLPERVVSAPSIYAFENRLDRLWSNQDIKYNFEAALNKVYPQATDAEYLDLNQEDSRT